MYIFQYICENHFQRLSKTSIFTGLKAVNHFGRPDMSSFLKFVQKKHSYVSFRLNKNEKESIWHAECLIPLQFGKLLNKECIMNKCYVEDMFS